MQQLTIKILLLQRALKAVRVSVYATMYFFYLTVVFFLETEKKFTQVAYDNYKKIVKSILRCRKTINSPKNYF